MFEFGYDNSHHVKWNIDMPQSLEQFIVDRCTSLFIIHKPRKCMAAATHNSITLPAVCNNFGVEVSISSTSFDSRLHKIVQTSHKCVFNESIKFCAYESQLQTKQQQRNTDYTTGEPKARN